MVVIITIALVFTLNKDDKYLEIPETNTISGEQTSTTDFNAIYSVKKDTSKKVDFWVKNNGQVNIVISINDELHKILAPEEEGNITISSSPNTNYYFRAGATPNGGDISIEYEIGLIDN